MDDKKLTPHFSLSEFVNTSRKEFKQKNYNWALSHMNTLEDLAYFLEDVRKVCDCPITITSGIRCPELNKAVGGAPTSQHVTGHAADIIPQRHGSCQDHFCKLLKSHLIFDQLILEEANGKVWIHISYRGMSGRREALVYNGKRYTKVHEYDIV